MAAVSKERGLIHYLLRECSIKQADFCEFLQGVKATTATPNLHMLVDNCSVYCAK